MVNLSIITVSYKSKEHLKVLLPSVWESKGINIDNTTADKSANYNAEIIVVDNGSSDETYEWLTTLIHGRENLWLIKNQNTGFAAGNNLGIKKASGKYILLLNPDTKLEPDTLRTMLDFMESRPDVGIAGCKIIKPDGTLDLACRRRFPNPWNSFKRLFLLNRKNYNYTDVNENQEMEVDSVVGAFMLIRNVGMSECRYVGMSDFRLPNGNYLDEDFFMYGEDLDLCWRCKEAGWKVWYYPKTNIVHYKGESSRKIPFQSLKWFHDAMWVFYCKHYRNQYPVFFNWLVWLGIKARMMALIIINFFKVEPKVSK